MQLVTRYSYRWMSVSYCVLSAEKKFGSVTTSLKKKGNCYMALHAVSSSEDLTATCAVALLSDSI